MRFNGAHRPSFLQVGLKLYQSVTQVIFDTILAHLLFVAGGTWGRNRVEEHTDTERALCLILPVKTNPAIVQQAVAGLNSGSIDLHMGNVEPIIVLANAIGVSLLS